jgi:hypothetical protein
VGRAEVTVRWSGGIGLRSIFAGLAAVAALPTAYLVLISLAQSPDHAFSQLRADLPYLGAISLGFGTQIGLFVELRTLRAGRGRAGALTTASAGTGSAAMLACCAHHLVDVLPIVGLSAAAAFLNDYRVPVLALSLGMNVLGIVVIGRRLLQARRSYSGNTRPVAEAALEF